MIRIFYAYLILLAISIITGFVTTWRLKRSDSPVKQLPWFLLLTLITELIALNYMLRYGRNHIVYNFYQVCQLGFYSYALNRMLVSKRMRTLLAWLATILISLSILNLFFIQGFASLNTVNYFSGAILIAFFSGYVLNEIFKRSATENPLQSAQFWICSAVLVLQSGMMPLLLASSLLVRFTQQEAVIILILINIVNFLTYGMFITAFWVAYKNRVRATL